MAVGFSRHIEPPSGCHLIAPPRWLPEPESLAHDTASTIAAASVGLVLASCGGSAGSASQASPAAAPATASPGCQTVAAAAPGESTLSFSSGGETGTYIQDTPASLGRTTPTPVVIDLHGYLEPASFEHLGTGLAAYGDRHGFITITPELDQSGPARWDFGAHSPDIAYLSSFLTSVERSQCIDERRVFVTGLSMGAFMTSAIACELSNRVAAVAPIAGVQAYSWCHPSRPVPVVAFHGTADPYVAYTGGPGPNALKLPATDNSGLTIGQELKLGHNASGGPALRSIPIQVAAWAKRNGCGSDPTKTHAASDVTLVTYPCPEGASVELYVVKAGGHTWPGGTAGVYPISSVGRMTTSISANQIMWAFFKSHPLQGPVG